MPTIEEIETDILAIIESLSLDISAIHNAVKTIGILEFANVKQFEKGINKQIRKFEDLRKRIQILGKLKTKELNKFKSKEEPTKTLCYECGHSLLSGGKALRCPKCNEMIHDGHCLHNHRVTCPQT